MPSTEEITGIFVKFHCHDETKMRAGSRGARRQLKEKGV